MPASLFAESPSALLVAGCAVFLGGLARGATGFGGALVMVPLLAVAFSPAIAVSLVLLIEAMGYADLVRHSARRIRWRQIAPLTAAAVLAAPVGVYAVTHVSAAPMARVIGAGIVVLAGVLLAGWRYAGQPAWPATLGVGIVSGLLDGAAAVPGPPVALFLYGGLQPSEQVRDNLAGYFLLLDAATLAVFWLEGTLRLHLLWLALLFLPVSLVANWMGVRLARWLPEAVLRRGALVMVVALVVALLVRPG